MSSDNQLLHEKHAHDNNVDNESSPRDVETEIENNAEGEENCDDIGDSNIEW